MRSYRPIIVLLIFATALLPQAALGSQHIALVESFTNVGCPYCPEGNAITHQFSEDYGPSLVLNVQYHVSWPSATDPFYVANPDENSARRAYYGINSVPQLYVDGSVIAAGSYDALAAAAKATLIPPSPLEIEVSTTLVGDQMTVNAWVTAVDDVPASGLVVRIALVEPYVHYDTAPGSNGETDFYCSMRDMLPDQAGTPISLVNGQTVLVSETATLDPTWQDVYPVVWVQDDGDKSVLQAASTLNRDYGLYFYSLDNADIRPFEELRSFSSHLRNTGTESDTYDVHIDKDMPAGWSASICVDGACLPPFQLDFDVPLGSEMEEEILVDMQSLTTPGQGIVTLTATSRADPSRSWVQTFKLISSGMPVLYVDDDGGLACEGYFTDPLDALGVGYAGWNRGSDGPLDATQLGYFDKVVWSTGQGYPSLDPTDRTALGSFLDGGGSAFVTGMDIGWDMCDEASPESSPEATAWYQSYLSALYAADGVSDLSLTGVDDDPIGDGLAFDISDTGENAQPWPSEIEPLGDAVACVRYSPSKIAGLHYDSGTFKVVYFAFGFEGIVEAADRELIMGRVLEWLEPDATGVEDEPLVRPHLVRAPQASPNPFNPRTELRFEVGGTVAAKVGVKLFDLRGRLVRTLYEGRVEPGVQSHVWDGTSDDGHRVASGVYVARVQVGDQQQSVKLTLAK